VGICRTGPQKADEQMFLATDESSRPKEDSQLQSS